MSVNGNKLNSSLLYKLKVVTLKTEAVNKSTQSLKTDISHIIIMGKRQTHSRRNGHTTQHRFRLNMITQV
jgi:hypothetical protein